MPSFDSIKNALDFNKRLRIFSAEEQTALQHTLSDRLGVGPNADFTGGALKTALEKRAADYTAFTALKDKLGQQEPAAAKTEEKKHAEEKPADYIKQVINKNLELLPATVAAQKHYEESVAYLKKVLAEPNMDADGFPNPLRAEKVIGFLFELRNEAREALLAQHKREIEAMKHSFATDNVFKQNLSHCQLDPSKTEKEALADLEKSHKEQVDSFDKAATASMEKVTSAAETQLNLTSLIETLHRYGHKDMKKKIDEERRKIEDKRIAAVRAANPQDPSLAQIITPGVEERISVEGLTLEGLGDIIANCGLVIKRQVDSKKKVSYALEFGNAIFNPLDALSPYPNKEAAMLLLAQLVKASGEDTIRMEIQFLNQDDPDPERYDERARQAYQACINAGFKPEKITIVLNGEVLKHKKETTEDKQEIKSIQERLYAGRAAEYQALQQNSERIQGITSKVTKTDDALKKYVTTPEYTEASKKIKEQIADLKAQAPPEMPEPSAPPMGMIK